MMLLLRVEGSAFRALLLKPMRLMTATMATMMLARFCVMGGGGEDDNDSLISSYVSLGNMQSSYNYATTKQT